MNTPRRNASKQRDAVLAAVRAFPGHPTAEEVHRAVRRLYPRVSLATVYRNLHLLAAAGTIGAADNGPDGAMVFDKMTAPHHHFMCMKCGAIMDIAPMRTQALAAHVAASVEGTVLATRLDFIGVCKNCNRSTSTSTITPRNSHASTQRVKNPRKSEGRVRR